MTVFVLDKCKQPLMPCSEKRARKLLNKGRARIHRLVPFTIRVVDRRVKRCSLQSIRIKIDPGSKFTGVALVLEKSECSIKVLNLFELLLRGNIIRNALRNRRSLRSRRRSANLRRRKARFDNRKRKAGWLPPSIQHRVDTIINFLRKLRKLCPITAISCESVRFDTQKMLNADIKGKEYQQGTLFNYEVKEYILEKYKHTCVYCDVKNVPFQLEHVVPRSRGGSNRISNLVLSCERCNQKKGTKPLEEFVSDKKRLSRIKLHLNKLSLRDAAAVNSSKAALYAELRSIGLPVELSSGANTKYNRSKLKIPKSHALDAVCVGVVESVVNWKQPTLLVACKGRGRYCRTLVDKYGFPRGYLMKTKKAFGFKTGDLVKALVTKGNMIGTYIGRVSIRERGSFNIKTATQRLQGISYNYCTILQYSDGYEYTLTQLDSIRGR